MLVRAGPDAWFSWSAYPLVALCGVLVFLYFAVSNLPQLSMHALSFSHLQLLCILVFEETFVQVQALQHRVPGVSPAPTTLPLSLAPQSQVAALGPHNSPCMHRAPAPLCVMAPCPRQTVASSAALLEETPEWSGFSLISHWACHL